MSATRLPGFDQVDAALVRCGIGIDVAELHGLLAGYLSAGGPLSAGNWLAPLQVDADAVQVSADRDLSDLFAATREALDDGQFGFDLLLPEEHAPLSERIDALFDWCRGFVGAFGLAAGHAPKLSEEGEEALADLVRLAAAVPEEDGDEEDEDALAEIEEFVRVAALLLHGDCALGPRHRGRLN